jgi:hypothetical protein
VLEIYRAKTIRVTKDRNFGRGFDVSDKLIGTSWDNEINVLVLCKKLRNYISGCDELDCSVWYFC